MRRSTFAPVPRLLLFNTDLEPGGTPTVVRELARRLRTCETDVEVACLGRSGPVAREIERDGGRVTAFDLGVRGLRSAVRRLRELVLDRRIDVVLSFLVHANTVASLARRTGDGVRWWQSVQTTQPRPRWHWHAQRLAARRADGFIVPSESVAEVAARRSGIDRRRVVVIPNGVEESDVSTFPRLPPPPTVPLRVAFLGRLDPVKRVPLLVRAVRSLDGVELDVYGEGPDRANIEAAAAGMTNVRLHGHTARERALATAGVLVLPSEAEGFGLALIEAMAAGVPVVGADVPGIRDVIRHGETGLLASPDTLADAIASVRDDPAAATGRATAALAWVRAQRTWQAVVPRYREVLGMP